MSVFEKADLKPTATSADLRRVMRQRNPPKKSQWIGWLFVLPAVLLVTVFFLSPLLMAAWMSLHNWPLFGETKWTGLENYRNLLSDRQFIRALLFTGEYTVLVTITIFAVAFPLALFLDSRKRFVNFFRTCYFLPSVVGFATACLLWVWLYNPDLGLFSVLLQRLGLAAKPVQFVQNYHYALLSILVMVTWRASGFTMLLLLTGIQSIPHDIQEAAKIDGAGGWQRFRLVTLPLMRRTLLLSLIMSITGSILAFDQFYIITLGGPRNQTLTAVYQIYRTSFMSFKLGYGSAMSIVLMIILVTFTMVQFLVLRERKTRNS